jgi:hypothetical protein
MHPVYKKCLKCFNGDKSCSYTKVTNLYLTCDDSAQGNGLK